MIFSYLPYVDIQFIIILIMSETGYSEVPGLISAFIPEYKQEHYHLHGRNIENW